MFINWRYKSVWPVLVRVTISVFSHRDREKGWKPLCPSPVSNRAPPEYKSLRLEPTFSVYENLKDSSSSSYTYSVFFMVFLGDISLLIYTVESVSVYFHPLFCLDSLWDFLYQKKLFKTNHFIHLTNKMYVYVPCATLFTSAVTSLAERGRNVRNNAYELFGRNTSWLLAVLLRTWG
jgi:hypothetical protein